MNIVWLIVLILVLIAAWFILTYNGLVGLRNRVEEAWSDIEVQLKRRYDLIPNLVNTVKGYATHESSVFENVAAARSVAMGARTPAEHAQAENALSQSLKSLFAVAEAYPQLQAAGNFAQLQTELADTENKIESSRRFYNGSARDYNSKLQSFPTNIIAGSFAFTKKEYFTAPDEVNTAPTVQF